MTGPGASPHGPRADQRYCGGELRCEDMENMRFNSAQRARDSGDARWLYGVSVRHEARAFMARQGYEHMRLYCT